MLSSFLVFSPPFPNSPPPFILHSLFITFSTFLFHSLLLFSFLRSQILSTSPFISSPPARKYVYFIYFFLSHFRRAFVFSFILYMSPSSSSFSSSSSSSSFSSPLQKDRPGWLKVEVTVTQTFTKFTSLRIPA